MWSPILLPPKVHRLSVKPGNYGARTGERFPGIFDESCVSPICTLYLRAQKSSQKSGDCHKQNIGHSLRELYQVPNTSAPPLSTSKKNGLLSQTPMTPPITNFHVSKNCRFLQGHGRIEWSSLLPTPLNLTYLPCTNTVGFLLIPT